MDVAVQEDMALCIESVYYEFHYALATINEQINLSLDK